MGPPSGPTTRRSGAPRTSVQNIASDG
jgi:hypothetical protein